jgi:Family of unknown function (DUF6502)
MARPGQRRRGTGIQGSKVSQDYAQDVLRQTLAILVQTGHSPRELTRMFRDLSRTLAEPDRPFDPQAMPYVTGLSHIVAHWYSDPAFRDAAGLPRRIPLRGRGPCLANLIRRLFPHQDVTQVTQSLLRANAIRRRGRLYAPTDRYIELRRDLVGVHVHGLMALAGMLRTVQHNIAAGDSVETLLERSAMNPYIPVRALPEIHRRIKREVTALLWKLDGYLRSWEVEPGTETTTHVGVGAYAYEDPIVTGAPHPRRSSRRKVPRRDLGVNRRRAANRA